MRLLTRHEIAAEYRMPLSSVVSRMAELDVVPFAPAKRGRGHHVLYDAEEIDIALKNEREIKQAKKGKQKPKVRRKPVQNIYEMGWARAKEHLTQSTPTQ